MKTLKGVYKTMLKDGTSSYRASITYKNKHISLGSFSCEKEAHKAYLEANSILVDKKYHYNKVPKKISLAHNKWIVLHNFRDNNIYIKNPIYLHKYFFSYFINKEEELYFDVDDLFYYSTHKIIKRDGYLFVNNFGTQINILSRYGIKNFAIDGKDYYFKDGNPLNLRYHNIVIINKYYGVSKYSKNSKDYFVAKININGVYIIGKYSSEKKAAIAYNKAADFLNNNKISNKNYIRNYIDNINSDTYKDIYNKIKISSKIVSLLN